MSTAPNSPFKAVVLGFASIAAAAFSAGPVLALDAAQLSDNYGALPLHFEENRGQAHDDVRFLSRGPGYTLYLTMQQAVFVVSPPDSSTRASAAVVRMNLEGAIARPIVSGRDKLPGKSHYFIGRDPADWHVNLPTYARVHYAAVYPGIDLVYYGNQGQLEYDFVVAPGADPRQIDLRFTGAERIEIDDHGTLVLVAAGINIRHQKPFFYQKWGGERRPVAGHFVLKGADRVGFEVAAYDTARPLIIDPVLLKYATYLGGSEDDSGLGIAVDKAGNAYVTGSTSSIDFPTSGGAFQPTRAGSDSTTDAFVSKLNANGSGLVYSTYLGGDGNDGSAGIAVDAAGNAYVSGSTTSEDFPTTPGAFQPTFAGTSDSFVAKLDATGTVLVYATYLGGSGRESSSGTVVVDDGGNAYLSGSTDSVDFPTTPAAFQPSLEPGVCFDPLFEPYPCHDAFAAKLNPDGSTLVYSTYLGGSGDDFANGIAVDVAGSTYLTGTTDSADFPTTASAFQPALAGVSGATDAFIAKLDTSASSLVYATYLGGAFTEFASAGIAVDLDGNAYVSGWTISHNFPTTPGAFQIEYGGGLCSPQFCTADAFVSKLNPTGSALVYSTFLGGNNGEGGFGIEVDPAGIAYVVGGTASPDFPTTQGAFQPSLAGSSSDAFVTRLNAAGSALDFSSYLGGNSSDSGNGIAVNAHGAGAGHVYVTGTTFTPDFDFPTTPNAAQPMAGGGRTDAFVAKILGAGAGAKPPRG